MDNLDQTKRELMDEVKGKPIEELNLKNSPRKILTTKPLCLATKVLAMTPLTHFRKSS